MVITEILLKKDMLLCKTSSERMNEEEYERRDCLGIRKTKELKADLVFCSSS
jgi:hypothetical protein